MINSCTPYYVVPAYNLFMERLKYLCDIANGKRLHWANVSAEAADLFRNWVRDWRNAETLEDVLDDWEMGHLLDDQLRVTTKTVGKKLQLDWMSPHSLWDRYLTNTLPSVSRNDEVVYLVLSFLLTPNCERLRQCPGCKKWFIAPRSSQKNCVSRCGSGAASRRIVTANRKSIYQQRIKACRDAYAKYLGKGNKTRLSAAQYIVEEANKRLPHDYRFGGRYMAKTNFITRHADEIGIKKEHR